MTPPKAKSIDKTALYRWSEEDKGFVAWDGAMQNLTDLRSGKAGTKVSDPNTVLLQEIVSLLQILILHDECKTEEKFTQKDIEENIT